MFLPITPISVLFCLHGLASGFRFTEEPGKEAPESRVLNNGRPLGYVPTSFQTTTPRYATAFTTPSIDYNSPELARDLMRVIDRLMFTIKLNSNRIKTLEEKLFNLEADFSNINDVSTQHISSSTISKKVLGPNNPPKVPTATKPPNPSKGPCREGFIKVGQNCYYFSATGRIRSTWEEAQASCQKYGSVLASPSDRVTFNRLSNHMLDDRRLGPSHWIGGVYPGLKWYWMSHGEPVDLDRTMWISRENSIVGRNIKATNITTFANSTHDGKLFNSTETKPNLISEKEYKIFQQRSNVTYALTEVINLINSLSGNLNLFDNIKDLNQQTSYSDTQSRAFTRNLEPWDTEQGFCMVFHDNYGDDHSYRYAADNCNRIQSFICEQS